MHTKLYGPLPELEKTVAFIAQAGIRILRECRRTRRRRRRSLPESMALDREVNAT